MNLKTKKNQVKKRKLELKFRVNRWRLSLLLGSWKFLNQTN